MKKLVLLILCILTLTACSKDEPDIVTPDPVIREDNPEVLVYGNTLDNINLDALVVETKEYIYYVYQQKNLLQINREDLNDVKLIYQNSMILTNLAYYDGYLYFIEENNSYNQLSRVNIDSGDKEKLQDVDSYDNILVIFEEKLHFIDTQSHFAKCNLDGSNKKLFGYTMIIHPAFDGEYYYGAGYDMTASDERLRIFQTNYKTDKSNTFYQKTIAQYVLPNPYGYTIIEHNENEYYVYATAEDGSNPEQLDFVLSRPFYKAVQGNYYGTSFDKNAYYEYNPETRTYTTISQDEENYAIWKVYATGVATEEMVLFETDEGLYYTPYDSGKGYLLYPLAEE